MRCTTYTSSSSREKRQHARASYGQQAQRLPPSPVLRPYHRVALYGFVCLCVICCVLQYIAICVCVFMILCHTDVKTVTVIVTCIVFSVVNKVTGNTKNIMAQLITPERKQEIILAMEKRINEISTTIKLYSDVYDYVDDMETWHIPDSDIMPLKGDIMRYVYFKKHKLEKKKKKQERLLAVVKALKTTADDYEEGDEDLRGRHHMSSEEVLDLFQVNPKRTKR